MTSTTAYEQEIADWRAEVEAALRTDDGWLTVVGLHWLREGPNTVGSDPECDVVLPPAAPARLGTITLVGGAAQIAFEPGAGATVNGQPADAAPLRSDAGSVPDVVAVADVSFFLIVRGGRTAVRVRDRGSEARRTFGGRRWYEVREEYRMEAAFTPYDPPRMVANVNMLGDVEQMPAAGTVAFELGGERLQLEAFAAKGGKLWFVFRDATSGRTTYPAARFLYAEAPEGGRVTLDFNRAYSPPCAFTDYATCPLPPEQNKLAVAIEAGERWHKVA